MPVVATPATSAVAPVPPRAPDRLLFAPRDPSQYGPPLPPDGYRHAGHYRPLVPLAECPDWTADRAGPLVVVGHDAAECSSAGQVGARRRSKVPRGAPDAWGAGPTYDGWYGPWEASGVKALPAAWLSAPPGPPAHPYMRSFEARQAAADARASGHVRPILVDDDGEVLEGLGRLDLLRQQGEAVVPAVVLTPAPGTRFLAERRLTLRRLALLPREARAALDTEFEAWQRARAARPAAAPPAHVPPQLEMWGELAPPTPPAPSPAYLSRLDARLAEGLTGRQAADEAPLLSLLTPETPVSRARLGRGARNA